MTTTLRIGNLAIGLVVLVFMIGAISFVFIDFESDLGVSGIGGDLYSLDNNLSSDSNLMVSELSSQVDDAEDLAPTADQQIEDRTASTSGVLNLFSKNIVTRFFRELSETFNIPRYIMLLLYSLLGIIVTLLVARFFMGSDRV